MSSNSISEGVDRRPVSDRMVSSRPRTSFFMWMALIMVASMFIGFAPTFYLRDLFGSTDALGNSRLPTYLVLHGIVLTVWFLLFLAQTVLIVTHTTELHRRLGVVGALLAVAVVVGATFATVRAIPRFTTAGADVDTVITLITGNLIGLLLFSGFVGAGVYFRRRPATHKRLMLLASVNLISPAFAPGRGIGRFIQPSVPVPLGLLVLIVPLVALLVYDVIVHRRPQAATIWGSVAMIVGIALFGVLVASGAGAVLVRWLA